MTKCKIIAICNQKGGVLKTSVSVNLSAGLAKKGYKVLAADLDPQGDLTTSLGFRLNDELPNTMATFMEQIIKGERACPKIGILPHFEGFKLLPGNIELAGVEMALVTIENRETVLSSCLDEVSDQYDYIIIDCPPSLSMLTINALAAANSVIIPVQAQFLPLKGMTKLVETIGNVQRGINPNLKIEGVVLTLVESTVFSRETEATLRQQYGGILKVYNTQIPRGTKAAEASAAGESLYVYSPRSKAGLAYVFLVDEVLGNG